MKTALVHLIFILLSLSSLAYIDRLREEAKVFSQERSIAKRVGIKVVGEEGEEWSIEGEELLSLGREVRLLDVLMRSGTYTVRADEVVINRGRNHATLRGRVEIRGDALFVKTEVARVNFDRGLITGKGKVFLWRGTNYFEGRGFRVRLRPLEVIIGGVKARHDI
jgi:hypothetical protein